MDANTYEDHMRTMVGKEAYLLFVFDKLISSVSAFSFLINNLDIAEYYDHLII